MEPMQVCFQKSITTAIGMGISEEVGGMVTVTVVCIIATGIFGNIIGETVFRILGIQDPMAKGLALGTSAMHWNSKGAGAGRSGRRHE